MAVGVGLFVAIKRLTINPKCLRRSLFYQVKTKPLIAAPVRPIAVGVGHQVVGFIEEIEPDDLMTYADRDWSDGRSYQRLGFDLVEQTPPQAFWVDSQTFNRYKQPNTDGHSKQIYNAGNFKFLKKLK